MQIQNTYGVIVGLAAGCVLGFGGLEAHGGGPYAADNMVLHSQIDLATFGAGTGNDCWGYVSPSGREYALMGLNNKVAFVEITDPTSADWFATISHSASLWGDVKVYQDVAYVVTDVSSAIGIQVIDMSDIDNHNVTLVRTLCCPSKSHNIAVDADSGYLYTCGSSGGSDRTVIFDLADPLDPLEVGTWGTYEHDVQIVTYTSGPNAGRQIMFGGSEGRGLDIIDVTDKSNTFLISRTSYPSVAYCHQVWTEDLQYLYVDDEGDGIPRTTVFDISDLSNPVMLGDFSSGTNAIDHNLYVHDGLIYEANYRSGLRIFDANVDPVNPPQVAWFDTYPDNDNDGFDGAWSCYPFFPSGTIIVSDMNRGLFVLGLELSTTCTGNEVMRFRCRLRGNGNFNILVRIIRAEPGAVLTVRRDGDPSTDKSVTIQANGRGRVSFRNLLPGAYFFETLECDVSGTRTCP